jgi:hypothetical protein
LFLPTNQLRSLTSCHNQAIKDRPPQRGPQKLKVKAQIEPIVFHSKKGGQQNENGLKLDVTLNSRILKTAPRF